jgi:hypothetical protein
VRRTAGVLAAGVLLAIATAGPAAAAVDRVSVTPDLHQVDTAVGGRFTISTRLSNDSDRATGPLIAHLNVASLTSDVYVDPEDWSPARTQWVDSLDPHGDTLLTWRLQAVNAGTFDAYVVLLPTGDPEPGRALAVSPSVRLGVADRQTISAGGVLPVVVAVPSVLGLLVLARARTRARRAGAVQQAREPSST